MRIEVKDVMGIKAAGLEIPEGTITEVVGPNASGKTSLATAAQACLTHSRNPLHLPATETAKWYLREGEGDGEASLQDGDENRVTWMPKADEMEIEGTAASTAESVGLIDFTARRGPKERAELFQAVLLPSPEEIIADLERDLAKALGLPEEAAAATGAESKTDLKGIIKTVRQRGWEAAEAVYVDRRKALQRQWAQTTSENYGIKKAVDWLPAGWLSEYDGKTTVEAETEVARAREALDQLHRVDAASQKEIDAIDEAVEQLPKLTDAHDKAQIAYNNQRSAVRAITAEQQDIASRCRSLEAQYKTMDAPETVPCPHCGEPLLIAAGKPVKPDLGDPVERDERQGQIANEINELNNRMNEKQNALDKAREKERSLDHAQLETGRAKQAAQGLAAKKGTVAVDTAERERALAEAEQSVETAKEVVRLVMARNTAEDLHNSIIRYDTIAKELGPRGIRARKMETGLKRVSRGLELLAETSGWPRVAIDEKGNVTYGGRPAPICSESERWRIQAMIQLSLAAVRGDRAVVLDRGDLLDADNRDRLRKAVDRVAGKAKTPMAVLICSTGPQPDYDGWNQVRIEGGAINGAA